MARYGFVSGIRTSHGKALTPAAAAGAPCPLCNKDDPPEMPPGFKVDTD
jgi:hypothetical protein